MRYFSRRVLGSAGVLLAACTLAFFVYPYWQGLVNVRQIGIEKGLFGPKTLKPYGPVVVKSESDLKDLIEGMIFVLKPTFDRDEYDDQWTAQCRDLEAAIRASKVDFAKETLILLPHTKGSGSITVGLSWPYLHSKKLVLNVWERVPWACTCDMAYHSFAVVVPNEVVAEVELSVRGIFQKTINLDSDPQEYLRDYRRAQKHSTARAGRMAPTAGYGLLFLTPANEGGIGYRFPHYIVGAPMMGEEKPEEIPAFRFPRFFPGATANLPVPAQPFGLDLSYTNIRDNDLREVAQLQQLTALDLSGTAISGAGLKELVAMKNLERLSLLRTNVGDNDMKALAELRNLKQLCLVTTKVTDAGLKELAPLRQLQTLQLNSIRMTNAGLKHLAAFSQLRTLDLGSTDVTDAGLKELQAFPELTTLRLGSKFLNGAGLKDLATLQHLKTLSLARENVTDADVKGIATLRHLETLVLFHTGITDASLKEIATMRQLQTLNLEGCRGVTDAGLHELARLLHLHTLDLNSTGITDAGLKHLAGFKQLRNLDLNRCNVTDAGLRSLSTVGTLEVLDIWGTTVTDVGVMELSQLKRLRILNVNPQVTDSGRKALRKALPELRLLPR